MARECNGDDDLQNKIELLRNIIRRKNSDAMDIEDSTLRRFLLARDMDINNAAKFLLKHLSWKLESIPKGFISESEIKNEIDQRKMFSQGFDKKGRPIGVFFGCRHNASTRDLSEFKQFAIYIIEKLCSRMEGSGEKFTVIVDLKNWGYSNFDLRGYVAGLDVLQNNYPERLGNLFFVHVPYLFIKAWKIICPFIDKNTKAKISFVEDKNLMSKLLEEIDESQIPEEYGGSLKLVPIEDSKPLK